jgi:hypothetical protein
VDSRVCHDSCLSRGGARLCAEFGDQDQETEVTFVKPGNGTIPIGLVLPSAGLPAGTYRLGVTLNDGSRPEPVMRTMDFEVK